MKRLLKAMLYGTLPILIVGFLGALLYGVFLVGRAIGLDVSGAAAMTTAVSIYAICVYAFYKINKWSFNLKKKE